MHFISCLDVTANAVAVSLTLQRLHFRGYFASSSKFSRKAEKREAESERERQMENAI